jgi:signal transduction histidine kinase
MEPAVTLPGNFSAGCYSSPTQMAQRKRSGEGEGGGRKRSARAPRTAAAAKPAGLEAVLAERTREVDEKSAALEAARHELRHLMDNLDKIVRQRSRALVESEAELRRKNAELARLNKMKGEFVSIAAHELRTPLTSIIGYLDLLAEGRFGSMPSGLLRPLESVRRNSQRLMRLVDEMLDASRIEAGRVSLKPRDCDLVEIVGAVVEDLTPLAATKQHVLTTEFADTPLIRADPDKILQVVWNLLSNAIRYTPEGGRIVATVDLAPRERYAGAWARLRVRDNGIGIPPDQRDRIFEPFSDVTSAKHHTSSGPDSAGLGLYIARGLVDLHGGIISVDSEENVYTEFSVLLPLAKS